MKRYAAYLVILALLIPMSASATRVDCEDNSTAELPVKVKLTIPAFLFLQVGNANQTPELTYNVGTNLASGAYTGSMPPAGESGLAPSSIRVFLPKSTNRTIPVPRPPCRVQK